MSKCWIAVASAAHVSIGQSGGFMQVCHGKRAPLLRLHPTDWVVYYSPTDQLGSKHKVQAFTAIGQVRCGDVYQADMGNGFRPFRRDVDWFAASHAPIAPLLNTLDFSTGKANWAYPLRFGLVEICVSDMQQIAIAMQTKNYL